MQAQIKKWGNSLAIRLPKKFTDQLHVTNGTIVNLNIQNNKIIMAPNKSPLDLLLDHINDDNCHKELFEDQISQGKESW
jgi:antitoxin MazE